MQNSKYDDKLSFKMRSPRQTQVCCDNSLCQHPDCWRLNLQQVREAVWRRNGIEPKDSPSRRSVKMDQVYLTKEQRLESADGGLPTLNVVDLFSDLDGRIKSAPDKKLRQPSLHRRSTSLPSLSPDQSQPTTSPQQIKMPYPSPAISPSARTEYQRKMLWKKQFANPSRTDTSLSRESGNTLKLATIGVHEVYEPEELYQDWEEVYVTSAYLVWCPSKKKRKKRKGSSMSSRKSSTKRPTSTDNKVIPKDVTEEFVPAAIETVKTIRPKSTKTPTGGQPYSPRKSPANQTSLRHYGMEDLSDLPKPILSGMLKRITQSNEVSPEQYPTKDPEMTSSATQNPTTTKPSTKARKLQDIMDLSAEFESLLAEEETASKVRLAVDINSRFTTPEEDEEIAKQKEQEESEKENQETEFNFTNQLDLIKKTDDKLAPSKTSRELLRMNSIGVPIEDLPSPKSHHCTSSIPRRLSLGAALEPVNIVLIDRSPETTPPNEPEVIPAMQPSKRIAKRPKKSSGLFVNIPHGRAGSAVEQSPYGEDENQLIYTAFRNSPSPVRAPAPTPISPDKYSDFFRHHPRVSQGNHNAALQDDDILTSMRKWNTLNNVYDNTEESGGQQGLSEVPISILRGSPVGTELVEGHNDQEASGERIFLTEEVETTDRKTKCRPITPERGFWEDNKVVVSLKDPPTGTRGRSPSPGSKTRIPKDIIEEFHGNLYGKQFTKAEANARQKAMNSKSKEIVLGPKITTSGWRPPRSRTPIQFAETPARFAPRPLKQPPQKSVPKSLQIVPIATQNLQRPKSTPPRITTPQSDFIAQVLSDSSLHNTGSVRTSLEARGPSTGASGTGSVPPPPSPEALIFTTEHSMAVSTLEPLREEDERSSRNTSVVGLADKEVVNPRLSPLGGGSEISEESIDLPKELSGDAEGIEEQEEKETQEVLADPQGFFQQNGTISQINELENQKINQESATNEKELEESKEQVKKEGLDAKNAEDGIKKEDEETSSSPLLENFESNKPKSTESVPQDIGPSDLAQPFEFKEPRPSESPEVNPPPRGSPEPVAQPPGSPDMTSEPDFTEGVDMGLDLTAELQAAMEGLEDFVLDDENDGVDNQDGDNVDDNIESNNGNEGINTTRNGTENMNENSMESEEGRDDNKNLIGGENKQGSNDHSDEKSISDSIQNDTDDLSKKNMDRPNDEINVDSEDKIMTDIKDGKNNHDSDITQDNTNKIDPEINYFDRTSPLLDA